MSLFDQSAYPPKAQPRIVLVDLSGIFHAAWHSSGNDDVSAARERTTKRIREIAEGHEYVALCADAPGKTWRHDAYPEYKANRDGKRTPALYAELDATKERLIDDGWLVWQCPTFEADDVIATACRVARERGMLVTIASSDKDLAQLVFGDDIVIHSTMSDEIRNEDAVVKKYGVPPNLMRDFLALVGDPADNVPGVPKVGAVIAAKLLKQFGGFEGIIRAAGAKDKSIGEAVRLSILEHQVQLLLSVDLVSLKTDAPINFDEIFVEREIKALPVRQYAGGYSEDDGPFVDAVIATHGAPKPVAGVVIPEMIDDHPDPQNGDNASQAVAKAEKKPEPPKPEDRALILSLPREERLQPSGPESAWKLAQKLFQARLWEKFKSPEQIFAVLIRGSELGMAAGQALDCFHVIEGKPTLSAMAIHALAKAHPKCEYFMLVESTDERATYETKHRDDPRPTPLTYTIEQARIAGLLGNPRTPWTKNPGDMLRKTCAVKLARIVYPDAALGLYAAEEMERG